MLRLTGITPVRNGQLLPATGFPPLTCSQLPKSDRDPVAATRPTRVSDAIAQAGEFMNKFYEPSRRYVLSTGGTATDEPGVFGVAVFGDRANALSHCAELRSITSWLMGSYHYKLGVIPQASRITTVISVPVPCPK